MPDCLSPSGVVRCNHNFTLMQGSSSDKIFSRGQGAQPVDCHLPRKIRQLASGIPIAIILLGYFSKLREFFARSTFNMDYSALPH